eukprot:4038885-Amphidinium_carterae.1
MNTTPPFRLPGQKNFRMNSCKNLPFSDVLDGLDLFAVRFVSESADRDGVLKASAGGQQAKFLP